MAHSVYYQSTWKQSHVYEVPGDTTSAFEDEIITGSASFMSKHFI